MTPQDPAPEVLALVQLVDRLQHEAREATIRATWLEAQLLQTQERIKLLPAPNDLVAVEVRAAVAETERAQLQAKLQDAEEQIRLLMAPWWRRWFG